MKFSNLLQDSESKPFYFAIVFAVVIVIALLTRDSHGQENSNTLKWTTSFEEAVDAAEESNAPIMMFFEGSDWCPWCKKMKEEIFDQKEFANWTDGRLVAVHLDFPKKKDLPEQLKKQNDELLEKYRQYLSGFPTALFVRPDGKVIGKLGYEPEGMRTWIHKAQKIVGKLDKKT